jgi:ABC-2 type transport system ATP-binding protein
MWEFIKDLRDKGKTIILTTHYMEEAEILCDRLAIMDQGKILKMDTPKKLIDDLLKKGFKKDIEVQQANLEDVFLDLTGKELRDE